MFARHRHRHRHGCRRHRYAWLLLFVLWLPLSQAAALSHLIGHHGRATVARDDAGTGQEPCSTCLTAATLVGGAIGGGDPPAALPAPDGARPCPPGLAFDVPRPLRPYQSRAPPHASS